MSESARQAVLGEARGAVRLETPARACSAREFRAFYAEHFAFVWRCVGALGVPSASQDDAAQEVFVVVHRRLPEFRGESSVRTWLYGIVRNVASNVRRSQRRKGGLSELQGDELSTQPDPHRNLETREAADFVQRFIDGLDEAKRDLFVLAVIEQLAMPEVAPILGVPLNTAYTRLRALRIELQSALAQYRAVP
jgi:RNA polymerase sigma-70 factor (ECF subfamily)